MSVNYQQLDRYKGSLYGSIQYNGLEYDFETPDNQVIGSPGGTSAIHHHYTKGMYSPQSSYSDIYGGEPPAYVYGELGGMYQVGHSAPYYMGQYQQPRDKMYTQNQGTLRRDNFVPGMENDQTPVELIPPPDSSSMINPSTGRTLSKEEIRSAVQEATSKMKSVISIPNPWVLFVLIFLLWLSFNFWISGGEKFISGVFHQGKELNWKWYFFYAVIFTLLFVFAANTFDVSIISLEQ